MLILLLKRPTFLMTDTCAQQFVGFHEAHRDKNRDTDQSCFVCCILQGGGQDNQVCCYPYTTSNPQKGGTAKWVDEIQTTLNLWILQFFQNCDTIPLNNIKGWRRICTSLAIVLRRVQRIVPREETPVILKTDTCA